jgi:hypothetical protein
MLRAASLGLAAVAAPKLRVRAPTVGGDEEHKDDGNPMADKEEGVAVERLVLEVGEVDAGKEGGVEYDKEAGKAASKEDVVAVAARGTVAARGAVAISNRHVWERTRYNEDHEASNVDGEFVDSGHGLQGGHVEKVEDGAADHEGGPVWVCSKLASDFSAVALEANRRSSVACRLATHDAAVGSLVIYLFVWRRWDCVAFAWVDVKEARWAVGVVYGKGFRRTNGQLWYTS